MKDISHLLYRDINWIIRERSFSLLGTQFGDDCWDKYWFMVSTKVRDSNLYHFWYLISEIIKNRGAPLFYR